MEKRNLARMVIFACLTTLLFTCSNSTKEGKHLFILSGQSNMSLLDPDTSFIPTLEAEFGKDNLIVVKNAEGGQPIRRWYKNWKPLHGEQPKVENDLYESLMTKVSSTIANQPIKTVTFIWMQGERDAREKHGEVYKQSLEGLYNQLVLDLKREDINFIIGRLSDFDMGNTNYPHWTMIRKIQVDLAESNPRFGWINTDDLNDGVNSKGEAIKNDLHMSEEGYSIMGKRFADKAIQLILLNNKL
ncbi:MAG: sialate O-acetylesterase [Maribacter sp.]|nr:sialate O-acetylesterase [Maribacter sp.]